MSDAVNAKFGLFGLLKLLDRFQGGELHDELAAIAQGLGLELPAVPPDSPGSSDETNGEVLASERICQFLESQTEPVSLAKIIAEVGLKKWTATSALYRLQRKGNVEHVARDAWQIRSAG